MSILAAATPSHSSTPFQEKITQALNPALRDIYSAAISAVQAGDLQFARLRYNDLQEKGRSIGDDLGVGLGLAGLGGVHLALKDYGHANQSYNEALPFLTRSGFKDLEGLTQVSIGEVQLQLQNPQEAIAAFEKALAIGESLILRASESEKVSILLVRGNVFFQMAIGHEKLQQFYDAANALLLAANDFVTVGDKAMAAASFWQAAHFLKDRVGKPQEAIGAFAKASKLFDELDQVKNALWTRLELGSAYFESGGTENFAKAVAVFEQALGVAEQQKRPDQIAYAQLGLAEALEAAGETEKALTHYQAFLKQDRLKGGGDYTTPANVDLVARTGKIYRHLGRYEEAIENYRAALLKLADAKDDGGEAEIATRLAETYSWIADRDSAIRYYKHALELYKKTGDIINQVNVSSALGELWISDKISMEAANEYFSNARQLLRSVDGLDLLSVLEKENVEQVLAGDSFTAFAQNKLSAFDRWPIIVAGNLYQRWGRVVGLAANIDSGLAMMNLARIYHFSLPFDREVGFERAKDLYFLGEGHRLKKNFDLALKLFRACEELAGELRTPEIHWPLSGLARTYEAMGDHAAAIEYYKKGLAVLESIFSQQGNERTRIGVLSGALYAYRGLVPLLLDAYKTSGDRRSLDEAFQYTERIKARAFRELYATTRAARLGDDFGTLVSKGEKNRIELQMINERLQNARVGSIESNRLLDRLDELRKSLEQLRQEAAKQNNSLAQVLALDPATLNQVQNVLEPDTALLEYSIGDQHITLWVITKEATHYELISVSGEQVLEAYLKTLRAPLYGSVDISQHVALGRQLYRELLGTAQNHLRGKKRLIIAPDGPLHYLPFETLIETSSQDNKSKPSTLADIPYLIKRFQVSYIPSASVLVAQQIQGRQQKTPAELPLLAFGDPVYRAEAVSKTQKGYSKPTTNISLRGRNFDRLKFSGDEVRRIASIWGIPPTSEHINLRDRASVERLRNMDLSKYRVVHFASHAVLGDKFSPVSQPALVLAHTGSGDEDNGLLQFSDILELKLAADLVVLSACETGLGEIHDGEGIVGLTRAFLYAGASSAVVSLWKVEDQSTSLLMERFYRRLRQGENKSAALRQAKLEIMKTQVELKATREQQSLAAPFFWAPFILTGDSGPLVQ